MSDDNPDFNAATYPANFQPPPGFPVPTAADIAAATTPSGTGLAQAPTGSSIPAWAWWAGGALGAVVLGYLGYRASRHDVTMYALKHARPTSRGFIIVDVKTREILSDLSPRREPLRQRLRLDPTLNQAAGIHQVMLYPGEEYDPKTYRP